MRVVVVYDISDNSKRSAAAKIIESYGLSRIQRSAFQGELQAARARDLARKLAIEIDPKTDVVHIFFIQPQDYARTIVIGRPLEALSLDDAKLLR